MNKSCSKELHRGFCESCSWRLNHHCLGAWIRIVEPVWNSLLYCCTQLRECIGLSKHRISMIVSISLQDVYYYRVYIRNPSPLLWDISSTSSSFWLALRAYADHPPSELFGCLLCFAYPPLQCALRPTLEWYREAVLLVISSIFHHYRSLERTPRTPQSL